MLSLCCTLAHVEVEIELVIEEVEDYEDLSLSQANNTCDKVEEDLISCATRWRQVTRREMVC